MLRQLFNKLWHHIVELRVAKNTEIKGEILDRETDEKLEFKLDQFKCKGGLEVYSGLRGKSFIIISPKLLLLKGTMLMGRSGVLVTADGHFIPEVSLNKPYYIRKSGDAKYYIRSFFQKARLLPGRHLVLSASVSDNYFMWVFYFLPLAVKVKEQFRIDCTNMTIWIGSHVKQFHLDSLHALGYQSIQVLDGKPKKLEELIVPSFDYLDVRDDLIGHYNILSRKSVLMVNRAFDLKLPKGLKIYISRRNAQGRRILNEKRVLEALTGFIEVNLESVSFLDQVKLFNQAQVVVAAHGAGLTNLVFGRDIQVFEFYPSNRPMNNPKNLQVCEYLQHEYHLIIIDHTDDNQNMIIEETEIQYIKRNIRTLKDC